MQAKPKPKSRRDKTGAEEMNEFIEKKKKKERTIELQSKLQLVCKKAKASAGIFFISASSAKARIAVVGAQKQKLPVGAKASVAGAPLGKEMATGIVPKSPAKPPPPPRGKEMATSVVPKPHAMPPPPYPAMKRKIVLLENRTLDVETITLNIVGNKDNDSDKDRETWTHTFVSDGAQYDPVKKALIVDIEEGKHTLAHSVARIQHKTSHGR
jgi:hypothetical protein